MSVSSLTHAGTARSTSSLSVNDRDRLLPAFGKIQGLLKMPGRKLRFVPAIRASD
jgi:hypothetical protein